MRSLQRIVPISFCVLSALILPGCEDANGSAHPSAQPVQHRTAMASVDAAAPVAPPASDAPAKPAAKPESKPADGKPAATRPAAPATPSLADREAAMTPVSQAPIPATQPGREGVAGRPIQQPVDPASYIVKAVPMEVDLGKIPTNDTKKAPFKLVNTGDEPMTVVSIRPACGCTMIKFTPNTVLQPKEELELEVQLSGGSRANTPLNKTVTITVEGQPDLILKLKAEAISFVNVEPATLNPETMPDGKFKLTSSDGHPFKIMSAQPAVLGDFDKEPKAVHELSMSWEKYREIGISRQAIIYLDHPKCQQVTVPVTFKPEEIAKAAVDRRARAGLDEQVLGDGNEVGDKDPSVPTRTPAEPDADTQLTTLIKERKNDEVLKKIAQGLDVNFRIHSSDSKNATILGMAGKFGNVQLIEALLATQKAELEATDDAGRTPLMHAATSKNPDAVRTLLKANASVSKRDVIGNTALTWAAGFGDVDSVRELIKAGSEVDVVGSITGWTPLIWAVGFGEVESIEPLLDAKANIEVGDYLQGATPLIFAARTGKLEAIKVLINRGADVDAPDRNGNTPLLAASGTTGTAEKVKALVDAGADIHAKDNRGLNALDLARKRTDVRAQDVIKYLEPLLGNETPAADAGDDQNKGTEKKSASTPVAGH